MKHTPGPWSISQTGKYVRLCIPGTILNICKLELSPCPERDANAALISAAPEMIDCLQYIGSVAPAQPGDGSSPLEDDKLVEIVITGKSLKDIWAAIAKATN